MKERIFPLLFHKETDYFNYDDCKFDMSTEKEGTGRIAVRKQFGILNSYTLETSVCGTNRGEYAGCHFTIPLLKSLGDEFCLTIYDMVSDAKKVDKAI